jgi:subtilisin family serine protease
MDDHFHGTHVAGTIGAVGNDAYGITGVNWNVQIMALKFLDASGGATRATQSSFELRRRQRRRLEQ